MAKKAKYGVDSLVCSRSSVAGTLQGGKIVDVPANHPRLQSITAANLPALTVRSGASVWTGLGVDPYRNLVLGQPSAATVYTFDAASADASPAQTEIFDVTDQAGYETNWQVHAVAVTETAWFVFIGRDNSVAPDGATKQCAVFRCTNFSTPAWTEVHSNLYGPPAIPATSASSSRVAYGTYKTWNLSLGAGGQDLFKATVYLSEDNGATWETAMSILSTELVGGVYRIFHHVHGIGLDPADDDKVYVILGDGTIATGTPPEFYSCSRSGAVWTATALLRGWNHGLCYHAGEWYASQFEISTIDVATGRRSRVYLPPSPHAAGTTNYPYVQNQWATGYARTMKSYGGVLYAGYMKGSIGAEGYDAIMASVNGRDWSCIARMTGNSGYHAIFGYAGGKMWVGYDDSGAAYRVASFTPVSAATVNAVRIERARSNLISTREDSTFVTSADVPSVGHWVGYGSYVPSLGPEVVADPLASNGYCMHWKSKVSSQYTLIESATQSHFVASHGGAALASGDLFCMSCRVWSPNSDYRHRISLDHYPRTNIASWYASQSLALSATPHRIWPIGKCTGAPDAGIKFWLWLNGPITTEVIKLHADDFAWYKSTTEWPESDESQRGDVPRTAENLTLSLGAIPVSGYTLCWDWVGGLSPLALINAPILTLVADDNSYLEVSWVTATNKIQISNGTTTATMSTALVRLREDVLRFLLTYTPGVGHTLTVVDPLNGEQSCSADFSANFKVTTPANHVQIGASLGGITAAAQGLYWGLGRYNRVLSSGEKANHFAMAGAGLSDAPAAGYRRLI